MIERIKKLKKRNEELNPIVFKGFKPFSGELEKYKKKNIDVFEEYHNNQKEIELLEYELMSPEEQKRYDKGMEFLRLKGIGEPFDLSEFEDL